MAGRLPPSSSAGGVGGMQNGGASKMSRIQAQFQQKQMAEKEAKLLAMLDNQQQRLIQHTNGVLNKYNNNPPPTVPPGKVRQMFEERRKGSGLSASTVSSKGIDKSNPLDPLVTPPVKSSNRVGGVSTTSAPAPHVKPLPKKTSAPPLQPATRPSNLGSSKKPQPPSPITTPTFSNSSKPVTPLTTTPTYNQSLPPSRNSGGSGGGGAKSSASSSASSRHSPTTNFPPVANTTKYSEYASELDRREATLSNKLKGLDISKKTTTPPPKPRGANSNASSTRTTPSPVVAGSKPTKTPPRPRGSPPPGLEACKMCGRFFASDRISKHETICKKTATKKRKVFDPTKMRMQGTEAEPYIRIVSAKPKVPPKGAQGKKKVDWRKKHEEFINTIRAAKEYQAHVAKGGNPADLPPPPPSDNSDYIQCPHCSRKFSEGAAERHIPKCNNIRSNKK